MAVAYGFRIGTPQQVKAKVSAYRRIIFNELPKDWGSRRRVRLSTLAARKSINAWKSYSSPDWENIEIRNEHFKQLKIIGSALDELGRNKGRNIDQLLFFAARKTGIDIDQFSLAMETLEVAAEMAGIVEVPKKENLTEYGKHDLIVGEFLMEHRVSMKCSSRILAKIRAYAPYNALHRERDKAKINIDVDKEANAIRQRLRNDKLKKGGKPI